MPAAYEISPGTVADIPELKTAFLSLHDHHRALSAVKLTEPDDRAWTERMHTYEQYFAEDRALLHLARIGGKCVGYAFTVFTLAATTRSRSLPDTPSSTRSPSSRGCAARASGLRCSTWSTRL